jgi:peptide subunit release factor RF-3
MVKSERHESQQFKTVRDSSSVVDCTAPTEKSLLFGGAIQLAGEVKARGARRRVRSD